MIALAATVALGAAVVAAVCDARTGYIPDAITRPGALVALACAAWAGHAVDAAQGAYAVGGALLALHLVTRGRGLGLGDVKLGTAIGAGLGIASGIVALGTAFAAGGCCAVGLLLARRARRGDTLRFGPFLAAGAAVAAFAAPGVR